MKRKPKRERWVQVFWLQPPGTEAESGRWARERHLQLDAVIGAFAKVRRVVRVEPAASGTSLVFKARRS